MRLVLLVMLFGIGHAFGQVHRHGNVDGVFAKTYDPRSDTIDILHYAINLNITDFTNRKISGFTEVRFTPKQNNIQYLRLDLLKLSVDSVEMNGNNLSFHHNDTLLSINLNNTYNTTDTVKVKIHYKGSPITDATGWGGFYFQSGYAYNLGVGFGADPHVYGRIWFPCFDNFIERAQYDFDITTNNGKIAYCNGELINDVNNIDGTRTRSWRLEQEVPSYLVSVAVGNYVDLKMSHQGIEKNIPILIASLAGDTVNVKKSIVNLKSAIQIYEERFGPYAWNRVGYALVPFNQGAMEHATNIAFPKSFLNGNTQYEDILVHELAHHWFGDLVTCSSQEEMWMNEGWASYCEYIFKEGMYGRKVYIDGIKTLHENLLHFARYKEGDLNLNDIPHAYTYGDHVYLKGAIMAHNLRGYLGDSLFFSSLKQSFQSNAFKSISNDQFEQSLSQASGVNLSHFFNDWIKQPGWSHFSIDSFEITKVNLLYHAKVYVRQMKYGNEHFHQQVPMEISFIDQNFNSYTKKVLFSGEYSIVELDVPISPKMIVLNMNDKISQAISSEQKIIKTTGTNNFVLGKMNLTINNISDSALLRIEHHYTGPKGKFNTTVNRISPQRYWSVDGIYNEHFKSKAQFNYDGRIGVFSGNTYLDHQLNILHEDSIVLLYRKNPSEEWNEYLYYIKNTGNNKTDKVGNIVIDSLVKGEYCLGIGVSNKVGIALQKEQKVQLIKLFPNPSNTNINIQFISKVNTEKIYEIEIYAISGKLISTEKIDSIKEMHTVNISDYAEGYYILALKENGKIVQNIKFGKEK